MSRIVCIDQYELQVEITRCVSVAGSRNTWASDWDYYGYQEMEFEVVSGLVYDENGDNPQDLGRNGCAAVAERYAEEIEEQLWDQLGGELDDDYDDWEAA
ncbi:hypothetical protein D3C76_944390 [compost metagenome]